MGEAETGGPAPDRARRPTRDHELYDSLRSECPVVPGQRLQARFPEKESRMESVLRESAAGGGGEAGRCRGDSRNEPIAYGNNRPGSCPLHSHYMLSTIGYLFLKELPHDAACLGASVAE